MMVESREGIMNLDHGGWGKTLFGAFKMNHVVGIQRRKRRRRKGTPGSKNISAKAQRCQLPETVALFWDIENRLKVEAN